jgi:hypothetical protein
MCEGAIMDLSNYTDEELRLLHTQTVNDISRYNNLQLAKKVSLNSAYGAIG